MLSRAERKIGTTVGNTPKCIGPGSYQVQPSYAQTQDMQHAPFGSQGDRAQGSMYSTQKASDWPSPNPAQYNVVDFYAPVVRPGGSSLANKSQRFSTPVAKAPDPGTYYQPTSLIKEKTQRAHKRDGSLKILRKPTPSSVPARWENLGYVVDPLSGEATKTESFVKPENGVSPAAYTIKDTVLHTGTGFANRTEQRRLITAQGKQGPAPGEYQESTRLQTSPQRKNNAAVYFTTSANPARAIVDRRAPAPNSYTITPKQFNSRAVPKEQQFFGSSTQRFKHTDEDKEKINTPKPGAYEETRRAIGSSSHKNQEYDRSPFNQSAARFPRTNHTKNTPGPQYNTESWQAGQAGVTQSLDSTVNVASKASFGSTSRRQDPFAVKPQHASNPAPWEYNNKPQNKKTPTKHKPSVNFKSTQSQRPKPSNLDTPAASKYNTRDQTQHRVAIPRKQVPFGTSKDRFDGVISVNAGRFTDMANPAPGQYQPPNNTRITGGKILQKSRFSDSQISTPGPNAYTLSSTHAHSTFKPSFNCTLDNKNHVF
eukprot:m.93001 g.93001  ORF g.93001 m.93001 type:complete len:539 (-) comp26592_c0_seq1:65-1681(-)